MPSSETTRLLSANGPVAARLPGYEERPQQLAMAHAIERSFADGLHLIVEAGTGVGKSFAYLVPAVLRATSGVRGSKPVVISTATIALQEQLFEKDIPFLRSVWDREFGAVLAKGRSNYLSRRRLSLAATRMRQAEVFEGGERDSLARLVEWAERTADGSRADLDFAPDPAAWEAAQSDRNNCLGKKCPTYESCFFQRAKRRIYNAHILIVNHHLLFADLALKMSGVSYLPDYEYLILDEAHEIESIASEHLGIKLSRSNVEYFLNSLWNPRSDRGLLRAYPHLEQIARPLVDRARVATDVAFDALLKVVLSRNEERLRLREPVGMSTESALPLQDLHFALKEASTASENEEETLEIEAAAQRALALSASIKTFIAQELPDQVYWLERAHSRQGNNVEMRAAPIHVGATLKARLFDTCRSVVLTSATLATGAPAQGKGLGSFRYLRDRLGFAPADDEDVLPLAQWKRTAADEGEDLVELYAGSGTRELLLGSPFDYTRQAVLRIPDMPEPNQEGYEQALARNVVKAIQGSEGGSFVLFTSYGQLRRTADAVTPELEAAGYSVLRQGEGVSRTRLLETFKQGTRMVLFGAETFWQGVDVPGDALVNVVITRLPFAVPTDPLIAARMEAIDAAGGNSFMEYSVPQAIIKLKQGFGRLIRRSTDRGTVTVLDSRIRRKHYGKRFLDALPPAKVELG